VEEHTQCLVLILPLSLTSRAGSVLGGRGGEMLGRRIRCQKGSGIVLANVMNFGGVNRRQTEIDRSIGFGSILRTIG